MDDNIYSTYHFPRRIRKISLARVSDTVFHFFIFWGTWLEGAEASTICFRVLEATTTLLQRTTATGLAAAE